MLCNLRKCCYEALSVHISGVYGCENVSSTKILLKTRKFAQKICMEHVLKKFSTKTNKQGF